MTFDERRATDLQEMAAQEIGGLTSKALEGVHQLATSLSSLDLVGPDDEVWAELALKGVVRILEQIELTTGAGVAIAEGDGTPLRPSLLAWWVRREDGIHPKLHSLNPGADSYYDFTRATWFTGPVHGGGPNLTPPYIDTWGTDDFTMTISVPLGRRQGGTVGVVAADIDARHYLNETEAVLAAAGATALVDRQGRVVASPDPRLETSTRWRPQSGGLGLRRSLDPWGWTIVTMPNG